MSQPPSAGRLVAVVVTNDRLEQLKVTLARLSQSPPEDLAALLVVDNASTDGTAEWLAGQGETRLHIIRSETNIGGAGGFEAGLRHAMRHLAPDWILVMDDDARPAPGALAAFHDAQRDARTAYAAATRYPGGGICEMNRPGLNPFARPSVLWRTLTGGGRDARHLGAAAFEGGELHEIDMGSFVGLFVPRAAIERVGYPDGGLFLYGDDVIYCLALRAAGIPILFDPRLGFEHDCATYAAHETTLRVRPLWKVYYIMRNRLIMYRRAAGPAFWIFAPLLVLRWTLAARHYGADAARFRRLLGRAVRDGLAGRTDLGLDAVKALAAPPS